MGDSLRCTEKWKERFAGCCPMIETSKATWHGQAEPFDLVPVCRPLLPSSTDLAPYLARIDLTRRYSNHGQLVLELQERLSKKMDGQFVAVASSGTAAIVGAILAAAGRATRNRPICILPAFTFIGTVSAVEQCGYEPYFVDVDQDSWQLEARQLEQHSILSRVGVVVAVSAFGKKVSQAPWQRFSEASGIPVVIDGAAMIEVLMSEPKDCIGSIPVALSFHATKAFSTAEGGAVVCNSQGMWKRCIEAMNFGYDFDRKSKVASINGKMSEYHAAVGLAELDVWETKKARFEAAAVHLRNQSIGPRLITAPEVSSSYALCVAPSFENAEMMTRKLESARIGWRHWYGSGAHAHPYTEKFERDELPVTDRLAKTLIGLPMSPDLSADDAAAIASALAN
jgi:dTDP-4-amino-4,6-dideoxygalactose transaminase